MNNLINTFLTFTLQSNFSNNFLSFVVQYHTACGNWYTVLGLTIVFLLFFGLSWWFNWSMLDTQLKFLEHHHTIGLKLSQDIRTAKNNGNQFNMDMDSDFPDCQLINKSYRNFFLNIGALCFYNAQWSRLPHIAYFVTWRFRRDPCLVGINVSACCLFFSFFICIVANCEWTNLYKFFDD